MILKRFSVVLVPSGERVTIYTYWYDLADLLVRFGRGWQGQIGSCRVGGASVRGLPPRLALNGPPLEHSDIDLGTQKLELGLSDAARQG